MTPELLKATLLMYNSEFRYVKSIDDFYQHTSLHRKRILLMGRHLIQEFSEDFCKVNKDLLMAFLSIHDEAKLNLDLVQYQGRPLIEALYQYYGRGIHKLNENSKLEMKEIIDLLNCEDQRISHQFFREHHLLNDAGVVNETAIELLRIEKIVDSVDRGMNFVSIEEFNRLMTPASLFLDEQDARYAVYLENCYYQLLAGLLRPSVIQKAS